MDRPYFSVSNLMDNSIEFKRVKDPTSHALFMFVYLYRLVLIAHAQMPLKRPC